MLHRINKADIKMVNLYGAYLSCRKRKMHTEQEQQFSIHVSSNLTKLRNELLSRTYQPMPVRSFLIDKPVLREIFAPEFRDRIDHHYIAEKLEPLFEKEFINDCYSCRKGRGTLYGIKRLKRFIAQCSANYTRDCYILLGDISGYFMSIDRKLLWTRLEKFLKEKYHGNDLDTLLWQVNTFLFASPLNHTRIKGNRKHWGDLPDNKSLFTCCGAPKPNVYKGEYTADMDHTRKGMAIGALPAQMLGNFFLTPFDHFCKKKLRFYGRYVDDFFVVHTDKEFLKVLIHELGDFLKEMGLSLHPAKIRILHYKQGIPYLGAYIKGRAVLPGKRLQGGFRKLLRCIDHIPTEKKYDPEIDKYAARFNSYLGLLSHLNARNYIRKNIGRHSRVYLFFKIDDNLKKAVSFYKIRHRQHLNVLKLSAHLYHQQFKHRLCHRKFRTRAEIYNSLYHSKYGVWPL